VDKAGLQSKLKRLDHAQRERPWLAIPVATVKKFGEDQSSNLASMIAFWAFFSIFPLLMALVTVLDYVLPADQRKRVLDHISGYLPLLDVSKIGALHGSWLALLVGLFSALWSGLTVVQITQQAFN
jgi:uncharacterized BrkB/YihY/UPF0761 family membrane protein